ncbi:MAG: Vitamin B12 dependent methionine synthase activation subunit [Clostridia bacterium]|nr:Vitamin B12 dependent methionine synthase activation subunit [Clostridia bacterium]
MINFFSGAGRLDRKETLRYLGYYGVKEEAAVSGVLDECEKLILPALRPAACYAVFDISRGDGVIDLGFARTESKALFKNLEGCNKIALFAATIGAEVDRLIIKYEKLSPARAAVLQAMGAAAAECWCDDVNAQITKEFGETKPRFSCGYGDLPIELQKDIFVALNATKNLGITLSENCFMTPTKSVTAIVGIK